MSIWLSSINKRRVPNQLKHVKSNVKFIYEQLLSSEVQKTVSGVLVTVEGTTLIGNVSLEEAKAHGLIAFRPDNEGKEMEAKGQTFNWTCVEITSGAIVVDGELIEPKDSKSATIICSADGDTLLAWDLKESEVADQPDVKPTYIQAGSNKSWLPEP